MVVDWRREGCVRNNTVIREHTNFAYFSVGNTVQEVSLIGGCFRGGQCIRHCIRKWTAASWRVTGGLLYQEVVDGGRFFRGSVQHWIRKWTAAGLKVMIYFVDDLEVTFRLGEERFVGGEHRFCIVL